MSHPTTPSGSASLSGQPTVATPNPYGALAGRLSWADSVHTQFSSLPPGGQPSVTGGAAPPHRFSTPPPSSSAQDQGRKRTRQELGSPSTVRPDTAAAVPPSSSSSAPARSYAGVVRNLLPPDNSRVSPPTLRRRLGAPILSSLDHLCMTTRFPDLRGHVAYISVPSSDWQPDYLRKLITGLPFPVGVDLFPRLHLIACSFADRLAVVRACSAPVAPFHF